MTRTLKHRVLASAALGLAAVATFAAPSIAQAKKPGVLEGKNVVVDKIELRKLRFSITPQIGMSLSQPFVHKGLVGAVLRFDITDWIGIRGSFMYGVVNIERSLLKDLVGKDGAGSGTLPQGFEDGAMTPGGGTNACAPGEAFCRNTADLFNPAPLVNDFQAGLTRLQFTSSLDLAFTPFAGKLGMFQSIFTEYDIYVFGGVGITQWKRHYPDVTTTSERNQIQNTDDRTAPNYCRVNAGMGAQSEECLLHPVKADEGIRVGPSFGAGTHIFITDWVSINLEVHDIMVQQNIVGLNATVGDVPAVVNNGPRSDDLGASDRVWAHNASVNLGATFYFPPKAKREKSVMQQKRKRRAKK